MHNAQHHNRGRQTLPGQPHSETDSPGDNGRRVLDAEVLGPDEGRGGERQDGFGHFRQAAGGGQAFGQFSGQVWTMNGQRACVTPAVGFFLFLLCLVQFGLLAAIGFAVFLGIGSLVTGMVQLRLMMQGRDPLPWLWRGLNWLGSYGLAAWLAGGRG